MAALNKDETHTINTAIKILGNAAENGYNPDNEHHLSASVLRKVASELSFIVRDKGSKS